MTVEYTHNISNAPANFLNRQLLSRERWQAILQYKQVFLQNEAEDPRKYSYMNQEVAASWIRSRNGGVNPYSVVTGSNLSPVELSEILDKNRGLIDTTYALIKSLEEVIIACGYIVYLFDKDGVVLLNNGSLESFAKLPEFDTRTGLLINEESEGTTAHELCLRLKHPVQLIGPEHYCIAFQNSIASAAPIKDANGDIQAVVVLVSQPLLNTPEEDTIKKVGPHSLCLVTTLATTIENEFNLKNRLNIVDNALHATLACIDEGIVTIDQQGQILHINPVGMRILKLRPEETEARNINEFLGNNSCLLDLAKKGENVTVEERFGVGLDKDYCIVK